MVSLSHNHRSFRVLSMTLSILIVSAIGSFSSTLSGQDALEPVKDEESGYLTLPMADGYDLRLPPHDKDDPAAVTAAKRAVAEVRQRRQSARKAITNILSGGTALSAQAQQQLNYWFDSVVFPEMTLLDDESLQSLPKNRLAFFRDYLERSTTAANVHDYIVQRTFDRMKFIAENNFHPAVRYHAMLMVGKLNSQEESLSAKTEAIPYAPALPYLIGEYKKEADQHEGVRVAALLGILRQAKANPAAIPADIRNDLIATMLSTIDSPTVKGDDAAKAWIRRRAIEVLAALGEPGDAGSVAKKLQMLVRDINLPASVRFTAALAFSNLRFTPELGEAAFEGNADVAALALEDCRSQMDWLKQERGRLKRLRQGGDGGYTGGYGGSAEVGGPGTEGGPIGAASPFSGPPGGGIGYETGGPSFVPGLEDGYTDQATDPTKALAELEQHRLRAFRRRCKTPVYFAAQTIGKNDESGLRKYARTPEQQQFLTNLISAMNDLQAATDAGIKDPDKKKDEGASSATVSGVFGSEYENQSYPTAEMAEAMTKSLDALEKVLKRAPGRKVVPGPKTDDPLADDPLSTDAPKAVDDPLAVP